MSTEQNKLLIRRFLEKLDKNLTGVDDLCEAEFVAHLPGSTKPTDREGFKQFISQFYAAFPLTFAVMMENG